MMEKIGSVYGEIEDSVNRPTSGVGKRFTNLRKSLTTESNPLPEHPTYKERLRYAFMCPPHGVVGDSLTQLVIAVLIWAVAWSVLQKEALPGGQVFALFILVVTCIVAGEIVAKIKLPSLLGMLLVGFMLQNVPGIDVAKDITQEVSSKLRLMALVVILVKAGLGLDYRKLRALSWAVLRLSLLPCAVEVVTVGVISHFLLKFPWLWAFMLGFVHSAVSPAVVVPCMLQLQSQGLGVDKGIPTLLIAAGSIENVVAISGFSLILGITFSQGSLAYNILRCPMEIVLGAAYGVLGGLFCWYIPHIKSKRLVTYRFVLLLGGGLFGMFGSRAVSLPGAGALSCLILPFVAREGWKRRGWPDGNDPMPGMISNIWLLFQPLLFGLIGAQVKIKTIKADTLGYAAIIMVVALTLRTITTFLSTFRANLKHREKLFASLAWIPKATVQAAIGSMALDKAKEVNAPESTIEMGRKILTIAVFLIVVTAPTGAVLITLTSSRLLSRDIKDTDQSDKKEMSQINSSFVGDEKQNASIPVTNNGIIQQSEKEVYSSKL